MSQAAWGGRFQKELDARVAAFTASITFDHRLYPYDIQGSIAHAEMLAHCGIITVKESRTLIRGLRQIKAELDRGALPFRVELEDIHMHIELRLRELVGDVGGKLHTARSRNDQIALDVRLYLKEVLWRTDAQLAAVQTALLDLAERYPDAVMPGYTHLQHAQPVLFAHHLLAYCEMCDRDRSRCADCAVRTDVLPLGAAALAGTSFPIDRRFVAQRLGFARVAANSMDAVSDRDHLIEFQAAAAICGMHFSRLAEELVLWSTREFGFVECDDAFATGSSIMPQKKNPDVCEMLRGKAARLLGNHVALLATMKGLPLAYHSDMQDDKVFLFDSVDTLDACLAIIPGLLATLTVKPEAMTRALARDFSTATELADHLAAKGVPFRQAHHVVGLLVRQCLDRCLGLEDLTLADLQAASPAFAADALERINPLTAVRTKTSEGGTAPSQVRKALRAARKRMGTADKPRVTTR